MKKINLIHPVTGDECRCSASKLAGFCAAGYEVAEGQDIPEQKVLVVGNGVSVESLQKALADAVRTAADALHRAELAEAEVAEVRATLADARRELHAVGARAERAESALAEIATAPTEALESSQKPSDDDKRDDLKKVAHIGRVTERKLYDAGVCTYHAVANASDDVLLSVDLAAADLAELRESAKALCK